MPILGVFDCDPHGIDIMRTYKYGSQRLSHEQNARVPGLQWLGVRIEDVLRASPPAVEGEGSQSSLGQSSQSSQSSLGQFSQGSQGSALLGKQATSNMNGGFLLMNEPCRIATNSTAQEPTATEPC
jgi:meiotic recombination protein SPO11